MSALSRLSPDDRRFLCDFQAGRLVPADFHHRDHIHAAWATLSTYPLLEAIARYTTSLRQLATIAGKPGIYHETITWAYLLLIHERLASGGGGLCWDEFADINADLLTWRPSILDTYYDKNVLASELARTTFLLPSPPSASSAPRLP